MKRITYQLAVPVVFLVLSVILIRQWGDLSSYMRNREELHALLTILPSLPYLLFAVLMVMGWRYNNAGLIFAALVLSGSYVVFTHHGEALPATPLVRLVAFLAPLNLLFASYHDKRRIFTAFGLTCTALLALQAGLVLLISVPLQYQHAAPWLLLNRMLPQVAAGHADLAREIIAVLSGGTFVDLPMISPVILAAYLLALSVLLYRFCRSLNIALTGYMGGVLALLLALLADHGSSGLMISFSMAGVIMLITTIEASFSMAYFDELTNLPGRRSLNEMMLNLGKTYAIAMLDIDHFKKFNDTYGHKTGDDVLKMVAGVFSKIRGGAKTFRYGGEEFTAVFPGRTAEQARPYLEEIRRNIEASDFVVRSPIRKKKSASDRGKSGPAKKKVGVTISIGVASSSKRLDTPDKVIKAADAILYKAKKAGRNCVRVG